MFRKRIYTDDEIVELVKKGNSENVLAYLYKKVQPKVYSWILKNNGSKEEAQDIFQDSIVAFYHYAVENKLKKGNSVEGFIFSIAKNKWINKSKQNQKLFRVDKEELIVSQGGEYREKREEVIVDLLSQLGEVCKELLTYSIFYKLPMEDIALKMGYESKDTAKTKNYKCKQRLVKLVKDKQGLKNILYNERKV